MGRMGRRNSTTWREEHRTHHKVGEKLKYVTVGRAREDRSLEQTIKFNEETEIPCCFSDIDCFYIY